MTAGRRGRAGMAGARSGRSIGRLFWLVITILLFIRLLIFWAIRGHPPPPPSNPSHISSHTDSRELDQQPGRIWRLSAQGWLGGRRPFFPCEDAYSPIYSSSRQWPSCVSFCLWEFLLVRWFRRRGWWAWSTTASTSFSHRICQKVELRGAAAGGPFGRGCDLSGVPVGFGRFWGWRPSSTPR